MLLLPALGDADVPELASQTVAAALLNVGDHAADAAAAHEMAGQLLESQTHWTWRGDVLVCDDDHAARRPGGMPYDDLLLVTRRLAA